jgi:hypothetical protein
MKWPGASTFFDRPAVSDTRSFYPGSLHEKIGWGEIWGHAGRTPGDAPAVSLIAQEQQEGRQGTIRQLGHKAILVTAIGWLKWVVGGEAAVAITHHISLAGAI